MFRSGLKADRVQLLEKADLVYGSLKVESVHLIEKAPRQDSNPGPPYIAARRTNHLAAPDPHLDTEHLKLS